MDEVIKKILVGVVHDGKKLLILERTADNTYDSKKWEFVSGFIDNAADVNQAIEHVKKETGLDVQLVKVGHTFTVRDVYGMRLIHPFLFKPKSDRVKLDNLHTGYAWVEPANLAKYDCVKDLDKNLTALGLSMV